MNGNLGEVRISKWVRSLNEKENKRLRVAEKLEDGIKQHNCEHKAKIWLNIPLDNGFIMRTKMCGKCKKKLEAWIFSQKTLGRDLNYVVRHRQKPEKPKKPNRGF